MAATSPGLAPVQPPPVSRSRLRAVFGYYPLQPHSNWTVKRVRTALDQHEIGRLRDSALLAEQMERSPRIWAALQTRVLGVLGLPFSVEPAKGKPLRKKTIVSKKPKTRAVTIASEFERIWGEVAPEECISEVLLRYVELGITIAEVVWNTSKGRWTPSLMPVHPGLTWYDRVAEHWWVMTRNGLEAVVPGDPKWFILQQTRTRPWMRGIVRCLGIEDKVRTEAVRDWSRWSERHGIPILVAKVPAESNQENRDSFFDSIKDLGSGGTTVMAPQGADDDASYGLELLEAKDEGWKGFKELIQLAADDAAIAILGQNLTQETKGGSLAAAKVHDRVRADYLEADAKLLAGAFYAQIARPWAKFNYGSEDLAPHVRWDPSVPDDTAALAATWQSAGAAISSWKSQGANIDMVALAEKLGLPLVEGEELIEPEPEPDPDEPVDGQDPEPDPKDARDPAAKES